MSISVANISSTCGGPFLVPRDGALVTRTGVPILQTYVLASWDVPGFAVPSLSVVAYLFHHELADKTIIWLCEVIFLDEAASRHAVWATFKCDLPGGKYSADLDRELKDRLQKMLLKPSR